MKILRLPALLSVLLPAALLAAPVQSTITAVTVYQDRAVVTRSAGAELAAGLTELTFDHLPESLNEQSLQVTGKGAAQATILDVSARQTYVDFTPNARVKDLEDQLKVLARQMRGLDDRKGVLEGQGAILARMEAALFAPPSKDVPRPDLGQFTQALGYLTEQKARLAADQAALDEQREDLQNKVATATAQLNEVKGAGGRSYKSVTVRVSAAQAGNLDLALSYTVPNASWAPSYDARVLSNERTVVLGYFGLVRQGTGEDWKDVALTLSTARPGLGGTAPALTAWNLDVFLPRPAMAKAAAHDALRRRELDERSRREVAAGAVNLQQMTSNAPSAPPPEEPDAEDAVATVEQGATSAVFRIASAASVPSDNSPQKVPITTARLAAHPEYLTAPKRQAVAFLTSKVVNSSEFPLLAGAMNVFLDGTFVANSRVRTVMAGEKFDLALGADEGIAIRHKRVQRFTEDTGLTGSGKRITYEYLITVQNNKKTDQHVIVLDQLPLSRNEKIVVRQLAPEPDAVKPTDEGVLKWALDLKPGEKREIPVKFTVEYPKELNLSGLEY